MNPLFCDPTVILNEQIKKVLEGALSNNVIFFPICPASTGSTFFYTISKIHNVFKEHWGLPETFDLDDNYKTLLASII